MSSEQTLRPGSGAVGRRRRLAARAAVLVAFGLARLTPRRLRAVLEVLARRARPADLDQTRAARQTVIAVSVTCAGESCLPRAIATALLCRLGGTWPQWCVGARVEPFIAHAWVEVDGLPVDEPFPPGALRSLIRVTAGTASDRTP